MAENNNNKSTTEIPPKPPNTGAILLILDKTTFALQHSVINLQAQEALQTTRAFIAFLENVVIEQAKETGKQEAMAQAKVKEKAKAS